MNTFAVFVMLFAAVTAQTANYCNVQTCSYYGSVTKNSLCQYKSNAVAFSCGGTQIVSVSAADQAVIVKMHNTLRNQVALGKQSGQPLATNMQIMKWDNELANMAQAWANQCTFGHDTCRNVDRFQVGQNAAMSGGTNITASWVTAVNMWFSEVKDMQSGYATTGNWFNNFSSVGHYTQMMWATSNLVGCAYMKLKSGGILNICNYGPTGNWRGMGPYTTGTKAASACTAGVSSAYPGLCN